MLSVVGTKRSREIPIKKPASWIFFITVVSHINKNKRKIGKKLGLSRVWKNSCRPISSVGGGSTYGLFFLNNSKLRNYKALLRKEAGWKTAKVLCA